MIRDLLSVKVPGISGRQFAAVKVTPAMREEVLATVREAGLEVELVKSSGAWFIRQVSA